MICCELPPWLSVAEFLVKKVASGGTWSDPARCFTYGTREWTQNHLVSFSVYFKIQRSRDEPLSCKCKPTV